VVVLNTVRAVLAVRVHSLPWPGKKDSVLLILTLTSLLCVSTTAYTVFSTPTPGLHRPSHVLMKAKHSDCAHIFHICHAAIIYVMKAKQS
jgi:hypothetical protein